MNLLLLDTVASQPMNKIYERIYLKSFRRTLRINLLPLHRLRVSCIPPALCARLCALVPLVPMVGR
jgi:hypothetical protein